MTTLYYTRGACSLSPHIALREAGIPFQLEAVDLRNKTLSDGSNFSAISKKGYVPVLKLDNGEVLTEGVVITQYIADQRPESKLAPAPGSFERLRLQEWLHYIATELHKGFGPLYSPQANDEFKQATKDRLASRFGFLSDHLEDKAFILGNDFSIADGYAFYTLRSWKYTAKVELDNYPTLAAYYARLSERPSVKSALEAENLPA